MEIAYPDFMDNKGVLYVIFNTSKGKNLSSKTKYYFEIINLDLAIIKKYFPEFSTTPGVFYVEKGKEKNYLNLSSTGMNEEVIDNWVQTYKLDKKK